MRRGGTKQVLFTECKCDFVIANSHGFSFVLDELKTDAFALLRTKTRLSSFLSLLQFTTTSLLSSGTNSMFHYLDAVM